jgi:hypothetical protein
MAKERDWAGFFSALAKFLTEVLPLILPLFVKEKVTAPQRRSQKRQSGPKRESPPDPGR